MKKLQILLLLLVQMGFIFTVWAQPRQKRVQVLVTPTEPTWTYQQKQRIDFEVKILKDGQLLPDQKVEYEIGPEKMSPEKSGSLVLDEGHTIIKGAKLREPGFLRCKVKVEVEGHTYMGWGTAGVSPEKIEASTLNTADFTAFWDSAKAELSRVEMEARMTLVPEYCTGKINVYHVQLNNINGSHFYGMLSMPKKSGKYPAILKVPGAGARPYGADLQAEEGFIVFRVGIHGIPVNLDPQVYRDMMRAAVSEYWINKLNDKNRYYYKRVYLGCVRAVDFIYSLPEFDGEKLAVTGGSQGGALSIVTAALDKRVKYLAALFPALCDLTAYSEGRAGGWPHMFQAYDNVRNPEWQLTAPYYDVVNFARRLTVPGWYSWGFNDNVCPPTSMYAAYNEITAPKELKLYLETAHWTYPEQREATDAWVEAKLKGGE